MYVDMHLGKGLYPCYLLVILHPKQSYPQRSAPSYQYQQAQAQQQLYGGDDKSAYLSSGSSGGFYPDPHGAPNVQQAGWTGGSGTNSAFNSQSSVSRGSSGGSSGMSGGPPGQFEW